MGSGKQSFSICTAPLYMRAVHQYNNHGSLSKISLTPSNNLAAVSYRAEIAAVRVGNLAAGGRHQPCKRGILGKQSAKLLK